MKTSEVFFEGEFLRGEGKRVKGFLSFNTEDNEFDILAPEGFDIESFLQKGTLLYNHKLWKDPNGNAIPIGEVEQVALVKVVSSEDPELWSIKEIGSGSIIDSFPRARVPNAVEGDRGLWAVARVDIPEVWSKVLRGILSGFSWAGKTIMRKVKLGELTRDVGIKTRLGEVSLVFSPQHPEALLVPMSKGAVVDTIENIKNDQEDYGIYGYVFSSTIYDEKSSSDYLDRSGFDKGEFIELQDGELVYLQTDRRFFKDSLKTIGLDKGVQVILGVLDASSLETDEKDEILRLTETLLSSNVICIDKEMSMTDKEISEDMALQTAAEKVVLKETQESAEAPDVVTRTETVTEMAAETVETKATEAPEVETPVAVAEVTTEAVVAEAAPMAASESATAPQPTVADIQSGLSETLKDESATIATTIIRAVKDDLGSMMTAFSDSMDKFRDSNEQLVSFFKSFAEAYASNAAAPEVASVKSAATEVEESEIEPDVATQISELKEMVKGLADSTPSLRARAEGTIEEKDEPNAIFGGESWPFKKN